MHASAIDRIQADLRSGARSALEVTEAFLAELEAREPEVRGFISVHAEQAREQVGQGGSQPAIPSYNSQHPPHQTPPRHAGARPRRP